MGEHQGEWMVLGSCLMVLLCCCTQGSQLWFCSWCNTASALLWLSPWAPHPEAQLIVIHSLTPRKQAEKLNFVKIFWSSSFAVPLFPPFKMTATEKQRAKCPLGHPNLNMDKLTLEWSISFLWTLPSNLYLHNPFLMFLVPVVSHPKSDEQELMFYSTSAGWAPRCVSVFQLKACFVGIVSSLGYNHISWNYFNSSWGWLKHEFSAPALLLAIRSQPPFPAGNKQSQRGTDLFGNGGRRGNRCLF